MATVTNVPVDISFAATDRVLQLGYWPEFKAMLEHAQQSMPGLRSIHAWFDDRVSADEAEIIIDIEVDDLRPQTPGMSEEPLRWRWNGWVVENFPPEVSRHFGLTVLPTDDGETDAR